MQRDQALQASLTRLHDILTAHVEDVLTVKRQFDPASNPTVRSNCEDSRPTVSATHSMLRDGSELSLPSASTSRLVTPTVVVSPPSDTPFGDRSQIISTSTQSGSQEPNPEDLHIELIQEFLDKHLHNVHSLSAALSNSESRRAHSYVSVGSAQIRSSDVPFPHRSVRVFSGNLDLDPEEQMKAYSHQYSILVIFSTFTAGLVLAWLQLMAGILPAPNKETDYKEAIHYILGFQFGYTALIFNFAIAIVAGADTAACTSGKPWTSLRSLERRFSILVFAQFLGYTLFGISIGTLLVPSASLSIVRMTMVVLPIALVTAGSDLANTSKDVRFMRHEAWNAMRNLVGIMNRVHKRK